jgi:hypothetical protein
MRVFAFTCRDASAASEPFFRASLSPFDVRESLYAILSSNKFSALGSVCTENLIRVDDVVESPKLAE